MSTTDQQDLPRVGRIVDPGGEGWPEEPRGLTNAERQLYGDFAASVRLMGQASVAAADAYGLACRAVYQDVPLVEDDDVSAKVYDDIIRETYELYEKALESFRWIAEQAIVERRRLEERVVEHNMRLESQIGVNQPAVTSSSRA